MPSALDPPPTSISRHRLASYGREGGGSPVDLRIVPLTQWSGELVSFGRASFDSSLTTSIHGVMALDG
uniref:Uncharacterized protein n=1 Tax=Kalanchoe fedtschenkoi TaxID=63787 RepID=A0A7N0ULH5_KALFE